MARFSLFVVCSTVATCQVSLLPTSVHTGAWLSTSALRLASSWHLPTLFRPGGPPNQRRALSRGTSPANLDRNAALVAHAGCKARTSEALRAWVWPPNPDPRVGAALTHLGRVHVRSRRTGAGAIVFS